MQQLPKHQHQGGGRGPVESSSKSRPSLIQATSPPPVKITTSLDHFIQQRHPRQNTASRVSEVDINALDQKLGQRNRSYGMI